MTVLVLLVTLPVTLLLGKAITRRSVWEREARERERAVDDGCGGIPDAELARVFDVAFRGSAARTPPSSDADDVGGGLGLAIAKGLVEAHRGRIQAHNHGPGCRFEVRLPLAMGVSR